MQNCKFLFLLLIGFLAMEFISGCNEDKPSITEAMIKLNSALTKDARALYFYNNPRLIKEEKIRTQKKDTTFYVYRLKIDQVANQDIVAESNLIGGYVWETVERATQDSVLYAKYNLPPLEFLKRRRKGEKMDTAAKATVIFFKTKNKDWQ